MCLKIPMYFQIAHYVFQQLLINIETQGKFIPCMHGFRMFSRCVYYVFWSKVAEIHPSELTRKIDQSDSFLPTTVLAYKTVLYLKSWQSK